MKSPQLKKGKKFRSLSVTLTGAFIVLCTAILLIVNGVDTYFYFGSLNKLIGNQQELTAQKAANTVYNFIQERLGLLERTATIGDLATISREKQKIVLQKLMGKENSFIQFVLLDTQMHEELRVSRFSKELSSELSQYNDSTLFSKVSRKEPYFSPVWVDQMSSEPMMALAVPVTDVFQRL